MIEYCDYSYLLDTLFFSFIFLTCEWDKVPSRGDIYILPHHQFSNVIMLIFQIISWWNPSIIYTHLPSSHPQSFSFYAAHIFRPCTLLFSLSLSLSFLSFDLFLHPPLCIFIIFFLFLLSPLALSLSLSSLLSAHFAFSLSLFHHDNSDLSRRPRQVREKSCKIRRAARFPAHLDLLGLSLRPILRLDQW